MTNQNSVDREWSDFLKLWLWERDAQGHLLHCDDWPLYASVEHEKLLKEKARTFGMPSISAYINSFVTLKREGLQKVRSTSWQLEAPEPDEPIVTRESYYAMPAADIIRRYRGEPAFRAGVDKLIQAGEI